MRNWNAPKVGEKYKINVRGGYKWTITISVCKNDSRVWQCHACERNIEPGELQGRVAGTHFCLACVDMNIIE